MSNPHESPNSKQNKYRYNLLEMRFVNVKDQFEYQTDCDNKKVQSQKELREEFFGSQCCTFGHILDQKNSVVNHKIAKEEKENSTENR